MSSLILLFDLGKEGKPKQPEQDGNSKEGSAEPTRKEGRKEGSFALVDFQTL